MGRCAVPDRYSTSTYLVLQSSPTVDTSESESAGNLPTSKAVVVDVLRTEPAGVIYVSHARLHRSFKSVLLFLLLYCTYE